MWNSTSGDLFTKKSPHILSHHPISCESSTNTILPENRGMSSQQPPPNGKKIKKGLFCFILSLSSGSPPFIFLSSPRLSSSLSFFHNRQQQPKIASCVFLWIRENAEERSFSFQRRVEEPERRGKEEGNREGNEEEDIQKHEIPLRCLTWSSESYVRPRWRTHTAWVCTRPYSSMYPTFVFSGTGE